MLEIANLTLDYPEFRTCYDLDVRKGTMCALIGLQAAARPRLHAIAGFARPIAGTLVFDSYDLLPLGPAERPLTLLFQEHNLFPHPRPRRTSGSGSVRTSA